MVRDQTGRTDVRFQDLLYTLQRFELLGDTRSDDAGLNIVFLLVLGEESHIVAELTIQCSGFVDDNINAGCWTSFRKLNAMINRGIGGACHVYYPDQRLQYSVADYNEI